MKADRVIKWINRAVSQLMDRFRSILVIFAASVHSRNSDEMVADNLNLIGLWRLEVIRPVARK